MRWVVVACVVASCSRDTGRSDRNEIPPVSVPGAQADLPPWFGLPDAPVRRIAGRLLAGDTPVQGVVHLRIAAPDPTVWTGLQRTTDAEGRFDFGAVRSGPYRILAVAPGTSSRLVDVDTTGGAAEALTIYAHACSTTSGTVRADGKPVAGARVDVGGVILATTDTSGAYRVCLPRERMSATIRAGGFVPTSTLFWPGVVERPEEALVEGIELQGTVVDAHGRPAPGVGVQPVYVEQVQMSHGSAYSQIPVQATTDAAGRFVVRWVSKLDRATAFGGRAPEPARYYVRVLDRTRVFDDRSAVVSGTDATALVRVTMTSPAAAPGRGSTDATIAGRVTHAGKPLPDALIEVPIINVRTWSTRTGPDGAFELGINQDGTTRVSVTHASGLSTERRVQVAPGQVTRIDIDVAAAGRIAGVAYDHAGKPLVEGTVWVVARDVPVRRYTQTGADGSFSVDNLEVGHIYDIEVSDGDTGTKVSSEVRLDATNPDALDLRLGITEKRGIEGVVVDERGAAIAGARVIVSEATFTRLASGGSTPNQPWIPSGVAARGMVAFAGFSQWELPTKTDGAGRFRWAPVQAGQQAILVIARDGRVGAADRVAPSDSPVHITVRRPGAIRVICKNFRPMSEDLGAGIEIVSGKRCATAACGETVGDMPAGHYRLATKAGRGKFAALEVEVRAGATTEAALEVKPAGRIEGKVVAYPGDMPLAGIECDYRWPAGDRSIGGDPGATSDATGTFALAVSQGRVEVECEDPRRAFADGHTLVDLGASARPIVRMVKVRLDGVDAGVQFAAEVAGARVTSVGSSASATGLQPGDLVTAADGASLSGLGPRAMAALAFTLPPKGSVTWTIRRGGAIRTIVAADR